MNEFLVVDASAILTLCFDDENNACGQSILEIAATGTNLIVPSIWPLEVGNGLLTAERKGRLNPDALTRFLSLLMDLDIAVDQRALWPTMNTTLPLARKYRLTTYDAAYLELALRQGSPLASLDKRLIDACVAAGGKVI